jgi:hypothetical protein
LEAACDFTLGMCAETPKEDGAFCGIGACKGGECVEIPDDGTGGAGGAGGAGGTGGSGGEPIIYEPIYVQGGCICGVTGRTSSRAPKIALVSIAFLALLMARRASRRAMPER